MSKKSRKILKQLREAMRREKTPKQKSTPKQPVKLYAKMYWSLSSCILFSSDWNGDYDSDEQVYINPEGYKSWIKNEEKYKALEFYFTRKSEDYLIVEFLESNVYTTEAGAKAITEYDAYMMDPSTNENVFLFHHVVSSRMNQEEE